MSSTPVRVLHSNPVWLAQTQTWIYNQVRYLPSDVEAHIVCEKTENLEQFTLPNIHSLEALPRWQVVWDKGIRKLGVRQHLQMVVQQAQTHHVSLLHSHFGHTGWRDLGAARRAKVKHVVTFYGFDVNYLPVQEPVWRQRYQELFQHVDRVLCEGSHMAQCIVRLGCPPEKVQVHHLGVAIDEIPFQPRVWQPGQPFRVLIAATFNEKKGIPDALAALGQIQADVPLEITVIGDARDVPSSQAEKQRILAVVEQYQLQSRIRWLGFQPYRVLFQEAYQHHLFLSPSVTAADGDTEGGAPVSLIEMAATGMPIVSTMHCDIPEVIQHGITGWLAAEHDIEGLVQHLRWWVQHPDQWQPLLQAGRDHVKREYDAQVQGDRLAAIYRDLTT